MALEGTITALEPQKHDAERVNLFLDGRFAFGLSATVAADNALALGAYVSTTQVAVLLQAEERQSALQVALSYLSYRERSEREVRRHLQDKGYARETVDTVVERLHAYHYLDDGVFAVSWIENRRRFRPRGERLLRSELLQKGVEREVVEQALSDAGGDELALARAAAEKKLKTVRAADEPTFRRRLGGFLLRKGFDHEVVQQVVGELWRQHGLDGGPDDAVG